VTAVFRNVLLSVTPFGACPVARKGLKIRVSFGSIFSDSSGTIGTEKSLRPIEIHLSTTLLAFSISVGSLEDLFHRVIALLFDPKEKLYTHYP
jgi:hypothetical protein